MLALVVAMGVWVDVVIIIVNHCIIGRCCNDVVGQCCKNVGSGILRVYRYQLFWGHCCYCYRWMVVVLYVYEISFVAKVVIMSSQASSLSTLTAHDGRAG